MQRLAVALLLACPRVPLAAESPVLPGTLPSGAVQLPNGRLLTPTGRQVSVASDPFAMALSPDGGRLVVASTGATDQSLQLLDARAGTLLHAVPVRRSWLG